MKETIIDLDIDSRIILKWWRNKMGYELDSAG
jgi:hypothetical protein